jgi:hypothetical protein
MIISLGTLIAMWPPREARPLRQASAPRPRRREEPVPELAGV